MDISAVKELIRREYRDLHNLQSVARRLNLSAETLRKEFVRKERNHVREYILLVRVEVMKKLLAETEKRCFEICYEVGFRREDSAAKIFKRLVGISMGQYRKMNAEPTEYGLSPSQAHATGQTVPGHSRITKCPHITRVSAKRQYRGD